MKPNSITWQALRIPRCLQIVTQSPKRLTLRLVREADRRAWEMVFDVTMTPKRLDGTLYLEPRRYRDTRKPDLSGVWAVAEQLPKGSKGRLFGTDYSVNMERCDHASGMELLEAMLKAVERQFMEAAA